MKPTKSEIIGELLCQIVTVRNSWWPDPDSYRAAMRKIKCLKAAIRSVRLTCDEEKRTLKP